MKLDKNKAIAISRVLSLNKMTKLSKSFQKLAKPLSNSQTLKNSKKLLETLENS